MLTWKVPKSMLLIFKFAAKSMPKVPLMRANISQIQRKGHTETEHLLVYKICVSWLIEEPFIADAHKVVIVDAFDEGRHCGCPGRDCSRVACGGGLPVHTNISQIQRNLAGEEIRTCWCLHTWVHLLEEK